MGMLVRVAEKMGQLKVLCCKANLPVYSCLEPASNTLSSLVYTLGTSAFSLMTSYFCWTVISIQGTADTGIARKGKHAVSWTYQADFSGRSWLSSPLSAHHPHLESSN